MKEGRKEVIVLAALFGNHLSERHTFKHKMLLR